MFTTANQVAVHEQLLHEAAKAVSFTEPLMTAGAVVAALVVLLWAVGCLSFGRVEPQDRGAIAQAPSRLRTERRAPRPRASLIGRHTPVA